MHILLLQFTGDVDLSAGVRARDAVKDALTRHYAYID